ncbi:conserved phage C-terminal domain-containing protein [Riemerella anatipestifer]|uniref:conserved phage C-terminal domain-containing protein n=1 Tax=Riemerella anatipestifer TaxID=34085 RepID=UPI0020A6CD58|nr:conserved phage C-terminal domain-containing protein [Riemerella anatipestifer]
MEKKEAGLQKTETETKPKHNLTETKDKPNKNQTETETKPNKNVNDNVNDNNVLLEKEPKGALSDLEEEGKAKLNNDIDFEKLLNFISDKTKRKFKTINDQIKRKYKARLKEGYTKEDILEAIENAVKDKYHMEQGYKYLTPEFFSRPITLDKYKNTTSQKATEKKKTYGIWSV